MNKILVRICVVCKTETRIGNFYKKYREYKSCNIRRVLKIYYDNKAKILQQRRDQCARFKDLDKRLKALEQKLSVNNNIT